MNEEQLIKNLKQLKTITPDNDWVLSNKTNILGSENNFDWFLFLKPGLVGASLFAVMVAFNFSQDSLPGELLFTLKKISEGKDTIFCSNDQKPIRNFELANKRLEELYLIAGSNEIKKITPAINEFQSTIKNVTKQLSRVYVTGNKVDEGLIDEAKKLEETKEVVGKTLASEFGGEAYNEYKIAMARLRVKAAEDLITKLRLVNLDEADSNKLDDMNKELELAKGYLDGEDYNPAFKIISEILEKISMLSKEKQIQ